MILSKIFTSFTFRFLVSYVAWLSVAVFMVLALIYAFIAYDFFAEVHHSVESELGALSEAYKNGGEEAVDEFVRIHSGPDRLIRFFYYVGDENLNKIAGNLDYWPDSQEYRNGWLGFSFESLTTASDFVGTEFVARSRQLSGGEHVLVARHYADVLNSTKLVGGALTRSMVATILLGTIGGAIVAALTLRRVDHINVTLRRIMTGDLSERIDTHASTGDFLRLSENVNQMLDRIEALMAGVRQVSDNIAHDLRTPLTRLRNKLSDLHENCEVAASRDQLEMLIEEADGLLGTFSALLRIAQVETGHRRSGFGDVDLCTLVSDVIELYEPLAAEKEQVFHTGLAKVGSFHGDRNLLFQAVANLLDNAIKYTPEGGRVQVNLAVQGSVVRIEVADSGIGIPEEDRERVFQRFFRVEHSRSRHAGNGLGLSLVQAVVRLHDGYIELKDNNPGLRIVLRFPRGH
ncbi:Signal-transduction histidine kinase senX3 [Zhongshania aliphaticivorans]|uniref:histidine kinase n=1 Tax=Zhongshania aliphaticivorans TaxID=1470434 RepID=A0A5S9NBC3_9GAMM|nr:HAMP domain-containing sensor histidine kinase [Zhongshania aliphaticivorans]CAA0087488.1 Signal-transduction histidine kinase senX3 [Zhongshania aliphaticivorans]CAA0114972.1 Signal-transduction histidine kinase senX3 [Zhongshania aliphaticivorans]CAA0119774.1 Signal-transduction histidine kinase senX3 [Zhongshania aliphaticivorans]